LAEEHGKTEREALAAFIAGFETSARLGGRFRAQAPVQGLSPELDLRPLRRRRYGERAARARSCSDRQRARRRGTTAGGLNASFGTMSKPFHLGKAALDGMLAAHLAGEGFEAATHLLDAPGGLSGTLVQDGSAKIEMPEFTDGLALAAQRLQALRLLQGDARLRRCRPRAERRG
jgi:hypothetical protein